MWGDSVVHAVHILLLQTLEVCLLLRWLLVTSLVKFGSLLLMHLSLWTSLLLVHRGDRSLISMCPSKAAVVSRPVLGNVDLGGRGRRAGGLLGQRGQPSGGQGASLAVTELRP